MPIATKWPRLIVVGRPVTEAQADEILIRTEGWHYISTNDRAWKWQIEQTASEVCGYPIEPPWSNDGERRVAAFRAQHEALREWRKRMGILDLGYLGNDRIASAWIGGPHGWCDWSGRVGCDNYNIGKWPSDEEVTADWQTIAAAFPFLDLTAQCVDDEGDGALAGQWRVKDGVVEYDPEPSDLLGNGVWEGPSILTVLTVGGERGCSVERLRQAIARVVENAAPAKGQPEEGAIDRQLGLNAKVLRVGAGENQTEGN